MNIRILKYALAWLAGGGTLAAADLTDKLPLQPCGIGRPATDRVWWGEWAQTPEGAAAIKRAEASLKAPMPPFDAERYLDYSTNGNRTRYQDQLTPRWNRFTRLVLGECLEGKGRFTPAIEQTVRGLCADPSWLMPAHDRNAQVFKGGEPYVDLAAAMNGYQMALAAWLLDGRLPAATLQLMRENVARRVTGPVLRTIDGTASKEVKAGHWWARTTNNWNAVCTAGTVGAILASEPSRATRTKAVAWAERNMEIFLSGFGKDGYCSEGIGYWNFGFGHYMILEELLRAQTGGQVDLCKAAAIPVIAGAPARLEITGGIYPAFADCGLTARPDARLVELVGWRLAKQAFTGRPSAALAESSTLYQIMTGLVVRREAAAAGTSAEPAVLARHSWFAESGVCVARPAQAGGMAVAWKGGHNGEHHNHNDVGTTIVVWKGKPVIADPGAMVYRAETFSRDRYRLPVLSSFGHSVPVVAGTLQAEGAQCSGQVLRTEFSDARDRVAIDCSSAYPDAGLKKLERQWTYQRDGNGSLAIEDSFEFAAPSAFASALVGLGDWYLVAGQERSARFLIDGGQDAVLQVDVEFSGRGAWEVRQILNPGRPTSSRLGLALVEPALNGFVRMTVRPAASGATATATKLACGTVPEKLPDLRLAPPPGTGS